MFVPSELRKKLLSILGRPAPDHEGNGHGGRRSMEMELSPGACLTGRSELVRHADVLQVLKQQVEAMI